MHKLLPITQASQILNNGLVTSDQKHCSCSQVYVSRLSVPSPPSCPTMDLCSQLCQNDFQRTSMKLVGEPEFWPEVIRLTFFEDIGMHSQYNWGKMCVSRDKSFF